MLLKMIFITSLMNDSAMAQEKYVQFRAGSKRRGGGETHVEPVSAKLINVT